MLKMKKRIFLFSALIVISFVLVVGFSLPFRSRPVVTQEDFQRLQTGMTQVEAERLLHGPPRNDLAYTAIIWLPQATGQRLSAWIEPEIPAARSFVREDISKRGRRGLRATSADDFFPQMMSKAGHQSVWVTKTGLIALYFGPDGCLQYKYRSDVHDQAPPSLGQWLASRPRMIRRSLGF
jgi:hypothetical protein